MMVVYMDTLSENAKKMHCIKLDVSRTCIAIVNELNKLLSIWKKCKHFMSSK
jgi:hypothetical protein